MELNREFGKNEARTAGLGLSSFFSPTAAAAAEHPPESRVKGWAGRPRGGDSRAAGILPLPLEVA